jgi:transposase
MRAGSPTTAAITTLVATTSSGATPIASVSGRLRGWQRAGVWQQLHHLLLEELSRQDRLDWSRASLDSLSVRAKRGAA